MTLYQVRHYLTSGESKDVYVEWLRHLRDASARIHIIRRVARAEQGNFGDHKFCRDGVWELRVDVGAGYRVYYAISGRQIVLLLCGGDKRTQNADLDRAVAYWQDWKRRGDNEKPIK